LWISICAGAIGPRYWEGRAARTRSEGWIKGIIEHIRLKQQNPPEDTAAYAIAWHRDLHGQLLNSKVAAVELINIVIIQF
jgi:fatty-acid peroxygenase